MTTDKNDYTAEDSLRLEESWLQASRAHFRNGFADYTQLAFAENTNESDPIDLMRQFYLCVNKGITPPANILIGVAKRFEGYDKSNGDLSLDVFFGNLKKQGKKDPLKQKINDERKWRVYFYMWSLIKEANLKGTPLAIYAAAGLAIDHFKLTTKKRDSLEKEYISAKAELVFNGFYDSMGSLVSDKNAEMFIDALR